MLGAVLVGALRFRILLLGVALGVVVVASLSLRSMPADVVPELAAGPVLEVQTEALGLSSQEVEQYVTVPLENNLLDGVMGVWDVRSQSIPGLSTVDLYFEPGTTMLHARQLVQERLTNAFSLPNVSKPPQLIQPLSSTSRVMLIGLRSQALSPLELSYLARWVIRPRLEGVSGVANVAIFGQQDRQIQVLVDPARLAAHHVSLAQIIDTAGNAQLVSPLSYLEGAAPGTGGFLDGPDQRLEIRPVLPLGTPRDLATVPVSDAPGHLPLGTVTRVVQSHQPMIGNAIVGGGSGLILEVQKLPSASVRGVTSGIDRALADLRPARAGVQINTSFFRPATYVSSGLHNLTIALVAAACLTLLALVALLLDAAAVGVTALAVAVSMLLSALLLHGLGYTLNALSVLGLLLAATVVVDDAVGTVQPIVARARHSEAAGGTSRGIVLAASLELRSTLGYALLIALVAIAPVFFAHGLSATFVHPLVLAYGLGVAVSGAVALTITPALAMLALERRKPWRWAAGRALGQRLAAGYEIVLHRVIALPRAGLACVCALGLAGIVALPFVGQPSRPSFRDRDLVIKWDAPAGTSLAEMDRITGRVLAQLRSLGSVSDAAAILGRAVTGDQIVDTSAGEIFVALKSGADYDHAVGQVRAIALGTPGIRASVSTYEQDVTDGVLAARPHQVVVRVYGEDYRRLRSLAWQIQVVMSHVPGVGIPQAQTPVSEPNIEVAINDAAALRAGVAPGDARRQASTLVSGLTVGNFFQDQAVFDVVVWGTPSARANLPAVRNLLISTSGRGYVRLGKIARVTVHADPVDIQHQALSRYVDVTAAVPAGDMASVDRAVTQVLHQVKFPLQYHAEVLGSTPDDPTSHFAFLSYLAAAALGVLLLLQAALRSWRVAALLFLVVPVSLSGGLIVALALGQASSIGAYAGLLAVFVFAARHAMLQIERIRRTQMREAAPLNSSLIVRAASSRLAEFTSSAVVIAAVMLPFAAMGDVGGNELTRTAAAVVLGGLLSTLVLNLLLLPALYLAIRPPSAPALGDPLEELAHELTVSAPTRT